MERVDLHSHILPDIDDGAVDKAETMAMLRAAVAAGITEIVATPHLNSTHADTAAMRERYSELRPQFKDEGVRLRMGYECNYRLTLDWTEDMLRPYCIEDTNILLLELPRTLLPQNWENTVAAIQRRGMDVIIAHPERYEFIQRDIGVAQRMVEIGCELQVTAGSLFGGLLSKTRKCAVTLLNEDMVSYIASDAHSAGDYAAYTRAHERYGNRLNGGLFTTTMRSDDNG